MIDEKLRRQSTYLSKLLAEQISAMLRLRDGFQKNIRQ